MRAALTVPELPEVETLRRGLAARITGMHITAAEIGYRKIFDGPDDAIKQDVVNHQISRVGRRGKVLILFLRESGSAPGSLAACPVMASAPRCCIAVGVGPRPAARPAQRPAASRRIASTISSGSMADPRGVRMSHDAHTFVLGIPAVFDEYLNTIRGNDPHTATRVPPAACRRPGTAATAYGYHAVVP
jgi:Formamidopyrimidine-DNA glycosylase N-terminal domain